MSEASVPPVLSDGIREEAARLGFDVTGWDHAADRGILDGNGEVFIGTHREIAAYLSAWSASRSAAARDLLNAPIRWTVLPFSPGPEARILPGQEVTIAIRPQWAPFLGHRLAISDRMADRFDVVDVKVGNRSILSDSPIPGFAFAATLAQRRVASVEDPGHASGTRFESPASEVEMSPSMLSRFGQALPFDACQTSMDLVLVVRARPDVGPEGSDFDAVIIGQMSSDRHGQASRRARAGERGHLAEGRPPRIRAGEVDGLIDRWRQIVGGDDPGRRK